MAKKTKSGFIVPPEVSPERKCIEFWIPNDVYDRGAFWGAMFELTYSWNWQVVDGGNAQDMADMWLKIWTEAYERSNGVTCCNQTPILHRIDPVTGQPQVSYDNGTTWVPDPNAIPNQITLLPPLVHDGSLSTKCDAATNASEHVNELIEATGTNLETAGTVFALAVAIAEAVLALFLILVSAGTLAAPVTAVATAIWAAATSLFALGEEAYDTYWTTDKKDAILCALFCNIGENGQFTEAQYQAFRTKVYSTLPASPALDIVMTSINAGGAIGLSQMASYGNAAEADCSSCDCGGVCGANWIDYNSVTHGHIIDFDEETGIMTVESTSNDMAFWSNDPSGMSCCKITGWETISGGGRNTLGASVIHCGDPRDLAHFSFTADLTGVCSSGFSMAVFHPTTIAFQFEGC